MTNTIDYYNTKNVNLYIFFVLLFVCVITGCQYLPEMANALDDIATDTAIKVEIDKEAISKDTDVHVLIDVLKKDNKSK